MQYGYTRVSTKGQKTSRQIEEMKKYGIPKENVFIDKASGKNFQRKAYNRLKSKLKAGDVLFIENLDRLGRTYKGLKEEWRELTDIKGVHIKVISNPLLDTTKDDSLLSVFLADIFLLISAFNAEQEYQHIKTRQEQGISTAKKTGAKFGRPKKDITKEQKDIIKRWQRKEISSDEAMELLTLKSTAFYNLIGKIENEEGSD